MQLPQQKFASQAAVGQILSDPAVLAAYYDNPDRVVEDTLKRQGVKKAERRKLTEQVKAQIKETDQVFPGLSRQEATRILFSSLGEPKLSFNVFLVLNVVLFAVGLLLIVLGAAMGLDRENEQFTAMFGGTGLAVLAIVFLTNPLKRVANAASDHSQVRTVVVGFWVQLANWRTELLEPKKQLDAKTIERVNREIQGSMEHAVKTLQKYAEGKELPLPDLKPGPAPPAGQT